MLEELINITERLCDGYRSMPCGCEGCPIWDLKECKRDSEHYKCDYVKILNQLGIEE